MDAASGTVENQFHHDNLCPAQSVKSDRLLVGVDGRSGWVRRLRDLINLHTNDLGGPDNASEAEKSIIRRAATLTVELEMLELAFAKGEGDAAALDLYQRTANSLRRLLESVGLKRVPRDVTPSVAAYVASLDQEDAA